jgi:Skp family chaperone for outer membrane proteins
MLKFKLSSLDGLDEAVSSLYEKKGDEYQLKIDGLPKPEDVSGLKAKVEELLSEKKEATAKAKQAEEEARKAAEDAARKSGDVAAIEKSWQEKYDALQTKLSEENTSLKSSINTMTVDSAASRIASEIAVPGSADVLIPHIRNRLSVEQRDGKFVTVVKDAEGKMSASSLDDLKNEFIGNPAYAPVIVGSKASGGGATGKNGGGAANSGKGDFGGDRQARKAAIQSKFPELTE